MSSSATSVFASEIVVSAPGKVILHGEHSVVYGKTALAVSIDLRTTVRIRTKQQPQSDKRQTTMINLNLPDMNANFSFVAKELRELACDASAKDDDLVARIREFVLRCGGRNIKVKVDRGDLSSAVVFLYMLLGQQRLGDVLQCGIDVDVTSKLPVGAGLGSSASFSVALAGAMHRLEALVQRTKVSVESNLTDDDEIVIMESFTSEEQGLERKTVETCLSRCTLYSILFLLQIFLDKYFIEHNTI
jgi:mevalonate kinase